VEAAGKDARQGVMTAVIVIEKQEWYGQPESKYSFRQSEK